MPRFCVGLDIGQRADYTALVVLEADRDEEQRLLLKVRHIDRFRGVLYPEVAQRAYRLTQTPPLRGRCDLVVDATGVGPAVTDIFRRRRIPHKAVLIHGGEKETYSEGYWRVPKKVLVYNLVVLFEEGRLKRPPGSKMPLSDVLAQELQDFRPKQNPDTGHLAFEHREGEHDDLVLGCALAAWAANKFGGGTTRAIASEPPPFGWDEPGKMPFSIPEGAISW